MAVDYSTDLGYVRLLISDTDETNQILPDDALNALIGREPTLKRAAATALDTIATSEALVSKVLRTQDRQTDGAKLAAELRTRAKTLREESDSEDGEGFFDIVDYDPHPAPRELAEWEEL